MDHFNGYSAVYGSDDFVPWTFPVVFKRIQNNGGRRLMRSGIAIIYLILQFKISNLKLDPCCSVLGAPSGLELTLIYK